MVFEYAAFLPLGCKGRNFMRVQIAQFSFPSIGHDFSAQKQQAQQAIMNGVKKVEVDPLEWLFNLLFLV